MFIALALVAAILASIPLMLGKKFVEAAIAFFFSFCIFWVALYVFTPSFAYPLFGGMGVLVVFAWIITGFINSVLNEDEGVKIFLGFIPAIIGVLAFIFVLLSGWSLFRHADYASLIGQVPERTWTEDVQPASPQHIRLVSQEMALWLADKQLGEAPGAIGSQFQIAPANMTLQEINHKLWYVVPLDYKGFSVWTSTQGAPGYIMVDGEDPLRPVIVKTNECFKFMPGAFFGKNLERHLWEEGYYKKVLGDYTFEIDDAGNAWWVVTVYHPTIAFTGDKVDGVALVSPTTGETKFYPLGDVPNWIDRVIPKTVVASYISYRGQYAGGWLNSWWSHHNITQPEDPNIIYGSDGQPYWATGITSNNANDQSLIGFIYTNSRTGKSVYYKAVGGTDEAALKAVDNKVAYRNWHGANPVLYNIYGTMADIVPVLGQSHTFQGVAIVQLGDMQVAFGEDEQSALREYQKLLATSGKQISPEIAHQRQTITGEVDRFAFDVKGSSTNYYIHIKGEPFVLVATTDISPLVPLTKSGDIVRAEIIKSGEDVIPALSFSNASLASIKSSPDQEEVRQEAAKWHKDEEQKQDAAALRDKLKNMSDQQLLKLLGSQSSSK